MEELLGFILCGHSETFRNGNLIERRGHSESFKNGRTARIHSLWPFRKQVDILKLNFYLICYLYLICYN